jgi:hypothetical protein
MDDDMDYYKGGIFTVPKIQAGPNPSDKAHKAKANSLTPNKRRSQPDMSPAIKRAATSTSEQIISPTTPPVALKQANQADQEAKLAQVLDKENVVLAVADTPMARCLL